ncbi:hypothetical protein CLOP_g13536, partial [Closterium sp. NIES-67]
LVPTCLCKPGFVEFVGIDCAEEGWNRSKPIVPPFTVLTKGTQKESQGKFIANPVILFANPAGPSLGCGVELAFSVSFTFSLIPQSGTFGSNGFAFVISAKAKVGNPDGVGYGGVETRSVAIEFDTRWNDNHGDINSQHVGLNVNGMDQSLVAEVSPFTLNDGSAYTAWVDYEPGDPGTIRVFLANLNAGTPAPSMYSAAINENVIQYSVPSPPPHPPPSTTLDFVLDSGATESVLCDAGTLHLLPAPTSLLGADSSFSIPCRHTSTLPCPLFPSGTVTGLHIASLCTNLLSQRSLQQAGITTVASYCEFHGIRQTHTLPHSPQQNGVAESRVREITKIARCLLVHASCPPSLWGYAHLHATLLTNLYPHPILPSTTPTELWTSAKPDVSSLRVWGSRAQSYNKTLAQLCRRAPVQQSQQQQQQLQQQFHPPQQHQQQQPSLLPRLHPQQQQRQQQMQLGLSNGSALLPISPDLSGTPVFAFSSAPTIFVPATYEEAMACPDAHLWLATILKELEAFIANSSFVDVPRPPSTTNMVKGKWVFRVKQLPGEPSVYKARYVAKGFTQRYDVHFFDTFSPTAKPATIRAVLDLAARLNMEIHSMDVSNAFLQGVLRKLIYMERPAGFHLPFPSDSVWQLRRPVYGLKQAPREWHAKLAATLAELGFSTSRADPSLFLRTSPSPFYILVYVDDMILITADSVELERVKRELGSRLKCKDLGELQHYLGMEITRDRAARTISLSQSHYLQQVLEWFDMARGTPQVTPLPVGHHLTPLTSPSSSSHPYAELIGSLMYAMVSTRPDLAYPISVLARFVGTGKHDAAHWQAAKRVLRYLQGTKDYVLTLGGPSPPLLTGYSDSSWADSRPDRCSSQGYGFSLGSGLISWRSTRSSSIALSSCEAELYAATMAAQEVRWLTFLLEELGAPQRCPTIWCDNASTIHLTKDAVFHGRSKHIELRHYFIRELVQGDHLQLGKIDSAANLADTFTKALPHAAHSSLLRLLGLAPPIPLSAS